MGSTSKKKEDTKPAGSMEFFAWGQHRKKTEDTKPAGNMEFFRLAPLVEASLLDVSSVPLGPSAG